MPGQSKEKILPGQELSLSVVRDSLRKDQNFIVAMETEVETEGQPRLEVGDTINLHMMVGDSQQWVGTVTVSHVMQCYVLDIPSFVMSKHQDPLFKNPMALYDHLQVRAGRRLTPVDIVYCIGFRVISSAKDDNH